MTALAKLTFVELKLFLRDPVALFFVLALPLGFLLIFGLSFGRGTLGTFLPAMEVALALGMVGLFTLPTYLATYREKGILRRLATTPVHPAMLLITQLLINLLMALVAAALVVVIGRLILGITVPENMPGFLVAFVLGVSALFSMGLIVAAVAPRGQAASAIGALLLYPSLFFAGAWLPKNRMPDLLARIGDYTPLGATQDMLRVTWAGAAPQPMQLAATAAFALLATAAAAKLFRWE
jgi:ABC-2 type transport system permease protein